VTGLPFFIQTGRGALRDEGDGRREKREIYKRVFFEMCGNAKLLMEIFIKFVCDILKWGKLDGKITT
jgi:hypothetical protein